MNICVSLVSHAWIRKYSLLSFNARLLWTYELWRKKQTYQPQYRCLSIICMWFCVCKKHSINCLRINSTLILNRNIREPFECMECTFAMEHSIISSNNTHLSILIRSKLRNTKPIPLTQVSLGSASSWSGSRP